MTDYGLGHVAKGREPKDELLHWILHDELNFGGHFRDHLLLPCFGVPGVLVFWNEYSEGVQQYRGEENLPRRSGQPPIVVVQTVAFPSRASQLQVNGVVGFLRSMRMRRWQPRLHRANNKHPRRSK